MTNIGIEKTAQKGRERKRKRSIFFLIGQLNNFYTSELSLILQENPYDVEVLADILKTDNKIAKHMRDREKLLVQLVSLNIRDRQK